ncbi:MAG: FAD-dependent oxidoreductase, partial [Verrucomicrobia bacterium]|nr:FAD-dependent oxidoreductase [Verrucomicrobiota bacterium]
PEMQGDQATPEPFEAVEAARRKVIDAEPNLELLLDNYVYSVETENSRITAVWAMSSHGKQRQRLAARFFVDATGHGTVGLKAGADYRMEPGDRMGMTNYWQWRWTDHEVEFPETPWALQLTEKAFPYPGDGPWLNKDGEVAKIQLDHPLFFSPAKKGYTGQWYWESGFDKHPLNDLEAIRDHNMRAAFGAFNAMKNHGAYAHLYERDNPHATAELYWMACIGGPRETLQLLGDVVVSENDIYGERDFPDACVPATWGIDLHLPLPLWARENPDNPFISRAHFDGHVDDSKGKWAESPRPGLCGEMRGKHDPKKGYLFPYRSFFSRNIDNLFMAGRDISCTHEALGTIRVMNTLGMVGVVVGRAASIACKHATTPRGVYENHLDELRELLAKPGNYRQSGG